MWVFEEPAVKRCCLPAYELKSETKLGHLMKIRTSSLDTLKKSSNITSIRLINREVREVGAALPQHLRDFTEDHSLFEQWNEESEHSFPSLCVTPAFGGVAGGRG